MQRTFVRRLANHDVGIRRTALPARSPNQRSQSGVETLIDDDAQHSRGRVCEHDVLGAIQYDNAGRQRGQQLAHSLLRRAGRGLDGSGRPASEPCHAVSVKRVSKRRVLQEFTLSKPARANRDTLGSDPRPMDIVVRCGTFPGAGTPDAIRRARLAGADGACIELLPVRDLPTDETERLIEVVGNASSLVIKAPWTPWGPVFDRVLGMLGDLVDARRDARAFGPLIVSTYDAVMARRLTRRLPDAWIALAQADEATLPQALARALAVDAQAVIVPVRTALADPFVVRRADEINVSTVCTGVRRAVDAQLLQVAGVVAALTDNGELPRELRRDTHRVPQLA
jgi:hypothetical protein